MKSDRTSVLLPGLDGTGDLFKSFVAALPPSLLPKIVQYPTDRFLSYEELFPFVTDAIPVARPFVLLAESFSTPLAVRLAAANPSNLTALVICAGFIKNPVPASLLWMKAFLRPSFFRVAPPRIVLEHFLIGGQAPHALGDALRRTLHSVAPNVIASRVRAVMACDAEEQLVRVQVPILYLQAEQDRMIRKACFGEISRIKPDTILASISAPHLVLQREPQRAAEIIGRFLDGLPA